MASGIARSMIVREIRMILTNRANNITFHNLHMIDVIEQLHTRRVHQATDLYSPGRMITLVVQVINFTVQEFDGECDACVLSGLRDTRESFRRYLNTCLITQTLTIAAKDNNRGNRPLFGKVQSGAKLLLKISVVLAPVQPLLNRESCIGRNNGETMLFDQWPVRLIDQFNALIANVRSGAHQCLW